jgi:FXSXX-COOH protein
VDDVPGEVTSGLIDLSDADLADLAEMEAVDNPVLATALQKIRDELAHREEPVAAWQSSL